MKKLCVTIFLFVIFVATALAPACAFADSVTHTTSYTPPHGCYKLTTLVDKGSPVGVRFSGFYFGNSGITVVVDVYNASSLTLDFYIGDADFDQDVPATSAKLSAYQTEVKHQLLDVFEQFHTFIVAVDEAANTQYDGTNGQTISDIFRYNSAHRGEKLQISEETYAMLQIARQMYQDTNGAFNPAVYRLVDLWGFSSRIYSNGNFGLPYDRPVTAQQFATNGYPLPDQKYIEAFSAPEFIDFSDAAVALTQQDGNFFVTKNVAPANVDGVEYDQWLDLGGIAKGYVVDGIKAKLDSLGWNNYYVDAGSSSSALGKGVNGENQTLLMADPFAPNANILPEVLLGFEVGKCSVSTSGQYVRKYTVNGVEYAHILDGATGAPAQTGVKAILVAVPEGQGLWASKSDCLTTALTVMGRDAIVEFINGYLKERDITVVVAYETLDGRRQILSNLDKQNIIEEGSRLNSYGWSLVADSDGNLYYDAEAKFEGKVDVYKTLLIVLGCLLGAALLAVVIYHFVKGRKTALQKVQQARRDKFFKVPDVAVYLLVLLLIGVLFTVFFGDGNSGWNTVCIQDMENGEQLFFFNAARNEYVVNSQNSNGWTVEVSAAGDGLSVKLSREINGELHFNVVKITRGSNPTVQMVDSLCGFHQDCVRNFGVVNVSGGAIVCSPNRLKIVTK